MVEDLCGEIRVCYNNVRGVGGCGIFVKHLLISNISDFEERLSVSTYHPLKQLKPTIIFMESRMFVPDSGYAFCDIFQLGCVLTYNLLVSSRSVTRACGGLFQIMYADYSVDSLILSEGSTP